MSDAGGIDSEIERLRVYLRPQARPAARDGELQQAAPAPAPAPVDEDGEGVSGEGLDGVDMDVVQVCAALDASDTDNAERFRLHFGRDYVVVAQEGVPGGDRAVWTGSHWDIANGPALAQTLASRLGGRIGLEAGFLDHTPDEVKAIKAAEGLGDDADSDTLSAGDKAKVRRANKAREQLGQRKKRRLNHAMTSKNAGRIESMFKMADPRFRRQPDQFNAHRLTFATRTHTITFEPVVTAHGPDGRPVHEAALHASEGHRREDWLTGVIPHAWAGLDAPAPRFRNFLEEMLPDDEKRRTVQQFAGLALTGIPLQYVMFHFGHGANGKSVFLEVITRVIGPSFAVGLPRESIVGGGDRGAGGASPDIIRLMFKRMVRILEVKGDVPLQEDLVKRLTGGETMPARALFKGYVEFQNTAKAHMSGNGKPTIDGGDYGTMRRLLLVHWDQTIPKEKRRDFEEVVSGFVREEASGILAWLAEGVMDWINCGMELFIAPSIQSDTGDYGEEQDPIGEFFRMCVTASPGTRVGGGELFEAFQNWRIVNGRPPRSLKKVGTRASERYAKSEIGGRTFYMDIALRDVPEPTEKPRNPYADSKFGY